ncbi:hypothetical protein NLI96_g359 [Meripilus lineatus]|uniref:F-box domain-containing protein n=1 Tax=Meripilus lineatus TaxID=2056292 RepID=A0AAD5YNZ9_9APHY|nr:hypothetical protein NLI96_g359 [Physisporinus lineatus]
MSKLSSGLVPSMDDDSQRNPEHTTTGLPVDPSPPEFVFLFPLEIEEMVVRFLRSNGEWVDAATLARCALVCRSWYRVVVKFLYTRVQVFGRKNYKLLERTLKENPSLGLQMHTLCIHDVTPAELASVGALHTLPRMTHLRIKELFIFGAPIPLPVNIKQSTITFPDRKSYPQHCHFLIPYNYLLLADLPRFTSLQSIQLYHCRTKSLDCLRKILGSLPSLNSAHFRDVWWGDPDAEFRSLHNATSWQISQFSLTNCTRNHAAPFFWAMPPESYQTKRRTHKDCRMCHPGICAADLVPLVKLADFLLGTESSHLELARASCWQWGQWRYEWEREDELEWGWGWGWGYGSDNDAEHKRCENISFLSPRDSLRKSHQGFLRCSVDTIDIEWIDGTYPQVPSFLCFQFGSVNPPTAQSDHKLERIVGIRIFFQDLKGDKYDLEKMESILCEFQELRGLKLDNLMYGGFELENVRFDLPRLREILELRRVPTSVEPPIVLREQIWRNEDQVDINSRLPWIKKEKLDLENRRLCCFRVRSQIGANWRSFSIETLASTLYDIISADSRPLILSSLMRLMDELLSRFFWKEAERVREGLLQVQRELAHDDRAKYVPLVTKTLRSMFQVEIKNEPGLGGDDEAFYSTNIDHLWDRMTRLDEMQSYNDPMYAAHFLETLKEVASSCHELGDRETATKFWVQIVDLCAQVAVEYRDHERAPHFDDMDYVPGTYAPSTYLPCLAHAIRNLALHSPQQLIVSSQQGNSRTRLWDAWAELARQGATDTPCFEKVLEDQLQYLLDYCDDPLSRAYDVPDSQLSRDAIISYQKATVDVWLKLAKRDPIAYAPRIAKVLEEMVSSFRSRDTDGIARPLPVMDYRYDGVKEFINLRRKILDVWRWVIRTSPLLIVSEYNNSPRLSASDVVGMWRGLAQRDNTSYGPRLENSLHHLALNLSQLQRSTDWFTLRYKAVAIWRELTGRNASAYVGHLVHSLHETGCRLVQIGNHDQAMMFYSEAVEAWRSHEKDDPTAFEISDIEALPLIDECVDGFRRLEQPEGLYPSLDIQSVVLAKVNKFVSAIAVSQESVQGFRSLGNQDPHQYHPGLASALHNLALHLCSLGRHNQALEAVEECLAVYRMLVSEEPSKYDRDVAELRRIYVFVLSQGGRSDETMKGSNEASETKRFLVPVNEVGDSESDSASQVRFIFHFGAISYKRVYIPQVDETESTNSLSSS